MTAEILALHQTAVRLCHQHRKLESEIMAVLQKIDELQLYKQFNCPSLFKYAVDVLGLNEPIAYSFIAVARKAREVLALQAALERQSLSVSRASRIISALNSQNADELINFAMTHTWRELDFEVARLNPKFEPRPKAKALSEESVHLSLTISKDTYDLLLRAQTLEAQRSSGSPSLEVTMATVLKFYSERNNPVKKAERAQSRKSHSVHAEKTKSGRVPLRAHEKHAVLARDQGRCTHVGPDGQRCTSERWLHLHHIQPVANGGANAPVNLTTLCSFHHDLVHQMVFPLENSLSWLRSPSLRYGHSTLYHTRLGL
jgi:5-methylcytosine-specific restriction endonuclease McrA